MKFISDGEIFNHREKNSSSNKVELRWKKKIFFVQRSEKLKFLRSPFASFNDFFLCFAVLRMQYRERQNQFCGFFFFNAEKSCGNYWSLIKDIKTIDSEEEEEEFETCFDRCRLAVIFLIFFPFRSRWNSSEENNR